MNEIDELHSRTVARLDKLSSVIDQRMTERALLLAMLKRTTYALTSVQLIGSADQRRASLCKEARALIKSVEDN